MTESASSDDPCLVFGVPPSKVSSEEASLAIMRWLVRLRWASVVALAMVAWTAQVVWRVRLPIVSVAALLAAFAATNALLSFQLRSPAPRRVVVGTVLLVDAGLLTGILYMVGGPMNPFSIVYLVGVTVAATALGHWWALGVGLVSSAAYGLTFFHYRPLQFEDPTLVGAAMTLHLSGMWVALTAASVLIAYFVGRLSETLSQMERELAATRSAAARSERLAALFALGAGAAHELATPLSTIRTAATELERERRRAGASGHADVAGYTDIIRREVDRCAMVLDQLSGRASATSATETPLSLDQLIDDLRHRLGDTLTRRLDITVDSHQTPLAIPAEPLRQALIALVRNAFDASTLEQRVAMHLRQGQVLRVEVIDQGRGMEASELASAAEPFFTTKPAGAGLGLGLFLVRAFADQMGGSLRFDSKPGAGTTVVLEIPARG